MKSEQYVESVKQMMNQQNVFFGVFIGILGIVLVFVGVMQWRLSDKQLKSIKEETKNEVLNEVHEKLIKFREKSNLEMIDMDKKISSNNQTNEIEKLIKERNTFQQLSLDYELLKVKKESNLLFKILCLCDIYSDYLKRDMSNLNSFIGEVNSIITFEYHKKKIDINSKDIDTFFHKMKDIENTYNTESFELTKCIKHVDDYRDEQRIENMNN